MGGEGRAPRAPVRRPARGPHVRRPARGELGRDVRPGGGLTTAEQSLFAVAERENPRRRFLFVSRVLGKHVPVAPDVARLAGVALALRAAGDPRADEAVAALLAHDEARARALVHDTALRPVAGGGDVTVLGFAETATALGHATADALGARRYLHTTRREVPGAPVVLRFGEDHSHAPHQHLYGDLPPGGTVALVDDELTTGRTALNLIAALQDVAPQRTYLVLCLIDHLEPAHHDAIAEAGARLGCEIRVVSLASARRTRLPDHEGPPAGSVPVVAGGAQAAQGAALEEAPVARAGADRSPVRDLVVPAGGVALGGRLGLDAAGRHALDRLAARAAAGLAGDEPAVVLGTGEFMALPLGTASHIGGTRFWSTTRSPVRVSDRDAAYPIRSGIAFPGPDTPGETGFLYNVHAVAGRHVAVCFEDHADRERASGLLTALHAAGAARTTAVTFDSRRAA